MKPIELYILYDPKTSSAAQVLQAPIGKPISLCNSSYRKYIARASDEERDARVITISDKHVLPVLVLLFRRPLLKLVHTVTDKNFINDVKGRAEDITEAVASHIDQILKNPPVGVYRLVKSTVTTTCKALINTPKFVTSLIPKPKAKPAPYITVEPLTGERKESPSKPAANPQAVVPASAAARPAAGEESGPTQSMLQQLAAMGFYPPGAARPAAAAPPTPAPPAAKPTPAPSTSSAPAKPAGLGGAGLGGAGLPGGGKGLGGAGLGGGLPGRAKASEESKAPAAGLGTALPARSKAAPAPAVSAPTIEEVGDDDDEEEWEEAEDEDLIEM